MRVFVLEDDDDLGSVMRVMLEARGHSCEIATSLAEARRKVSEKPYDYLLLDRMLPDGSGLELLDTLGGGESRDAVVFVVSGNVDDEVSADPRISACFQKPFTVKALLDAIKDPP